MPQLRLQRQGPVGAGLGARARGGAQQAGAEPFQLSRAHAVWRLPPGQAGVGVKQLAMGVADSALLGTLRNGEVTAVLLSLPFHDEARLRQPL